MELQASGPHACSSTWKKIRLFGSNKRHNRQDANGLLKNDDSHRRWIILNYICQKYFDCLLLTYQAATATGVSLYDITEQNLTKFKSFDSSSLVLVQHL